LLPGIDIIMDNIPSFFKAPFTSNDEKRLPKDNPFSSIRMTETEWLFFLIGMLCMSSSVFDAVLKSPDRITIYLCFENCSTILTICPLLSFLCRRASTWTPLRCMGITGVVCLASFLSSVLVCFDPASTAYTSLGVSSSCLVDCAAGLYLLVSLLSMYNTWVWERQQLVETATSADSKRAHEDLKQKRFNHFVVAIHMATIFFNLVLNAVWYWYSTLLTARELSVFVYCMVASSSLVFLIEFRVRKNEVTRALFALLDSKKHYVRYISHGKCAYSL
jgi:hypothetical protein